MQRPQDAPSRPARIAATQPVQRAPQPRAIRNPRPLYQCTKPDGDTYLSESGIPQGHYEPLWAGGYGTSGGTAGASGRGQQTNGPGQFRGGKSVQTRPDPYGPVTYVEDDCERMPQNDVCATLRDRDSDLDTRIFNALQEPYDKLLILLNACMGSFKPVVGRAGDRVLWPDDAERVPFVCGPAPRSGRCLFRHSRRP